MFESGIYQIQSVSNPHKIYIGSAVDIDIRWKVHKASLLDNTHFNYRLQNHVNKYGLNDLIFSCLCLCKRSELISREQEYINFIQPWFNINPTAGSRLNSKHSATTRVKMSRSKQINRHQKNREFKTGKFVKLEL